MGITYIEGVARGPTGKEKTTRLLGGQRCHLFPAREADLGSHRLGSEAGGDLHSVADGTEVRRHVSKCHMRLPQGEGYTPVILGELEDEALLGVVTLEILGLVFNPFSRTLQPMSVMLA